MLVLALAACSAVAQPRVYVLCVGEAGQGWVDKYAFTRAFTYELSAVNETWEVVVIEDVEDWGRLVEEAPEGVVVVNGHGEVMPLPASYADDPCSFLRLLARLVRDRGWVYVNPVGYAFWGVGNADVEGVGSYKPLEEEGLACFASELGLTATAWPPGPEEECTARPTELGSRLFEALGYDVPTPLPIPRPLRLVGGGGEAAPIWSLFKFTAGNVTCHGFAAYRVGRGYLLWGGLHGGVSDEVTAKLTAAMVAYFLDPSVVNRPPPLRPSQIHAIALAATIAAVGVIVLAAYIRSRRRAVTPPGAR